MMYYSHVKTSSLEPWLRQPPPASPDSNRKRMRVLFLAYFFPKPIQGAQLVERLKEWID